MSDFRHYDYAVNYARLSNTQDPNEISIERQCDNAHGFFRKHRLPHNCETDHFIEPKGHRSGWSEAARPAYRRMRENLKARQGKGLVWVQAQERFTRAEDATTVIRHWIDDIGVDLVFGDELVSLANFEDWMRVHTRSYIHAMESQLGKERMRRYFKKFYDSGAEHRRHPIFGLAIEGTGKERHNVVNPETMVSVLGFLELYATGTIGTGSLGLRLVRERGLLFQTKQHTPRPATQTDLRCIIANLEYYQPFLDKALYERCLHVREERQHCWKNTAILKHEPLLMRGMMSCAACGIRLYQQSNRITEHSGYRHPNFKYECVYESRQIGGRELDKFGYARLRELDSIPPESREHIIRRLTSVPEDEEGERDRNRKQALLVARNRLMDGWLVAGLTPEEFRDKRNELDVEIAGIPDRPPPVALMTEVEARQIFENLASVFDSAYATPTFANDLALLCFKSCKLDYATRQVEIKFRWE